VPVRRTCRLSRFGRRRERLNSRPCGEAKGHFGELQQRRHVQQSPRSAQPELMPRLRTPARAPGGMPAQNGRLSVFR
jgi:hypothetical protein